MNVFIGKALFNFIDQGSYKKYGFRAESILTTLYVFILYQATCLNWILFYHLSKLLKMS